MLTNSVAEKLIDSGLDLMIYSFDGGTKNSYEKMRPGRFKDNNFEDVILSNYAVVDLVTNYKLFDTYNLNVSAKNILNKRYSEAYEYKAPGRSLNFMLKKSY